MYVCTYIHVYIMFIICEYIYRSPAPYMMMSRISRMSLSARTSNCAVLWLSFKGGWLRLRKRTGGEYVCVCI
jgi:hypothetical protein